MGKLKTIEKNYQKNKEIMDNYKNKDSETIIKLATENDVVAQIVLAERYILGEKIKMDSEKGIKLLTNICDNG